MRLLVSREVIVRVFDGHKIVIAIVVDIGNGQIGDRQVGQSRRCG